MKTPCIYPMFVFANAMVLWATQGFWNMFYFHVSFIIPLLILGGTFLLIPKQEDTVEKHPSASHNIFMLAMAAWGLFAFLTLKAHVPEVHFLTPVLTALFIIAGWAELHPNTLKAKQKVSY